MGANNRELLTQIVLPAAMPQILTGLQVALPISLIVAVVAEMLMGGYGLGGAMMTASRFANSTGVFAGIVEIAVVGYVPGQGDGADAPPAADLAPGSQRADARRKCCSASATARPQACQKPLEPPTIFAVRDATLAMAKRKPDEPREETCAY